MPSFSSCPSVEPPCFSISPRPLTTAVSAPAESFSQACLNSAALMPAVSAHSRSCSPPFCTDASMLIMVFESAVPPASALMPTEENAADRPMMSASLMPTWAPAPAILMPKLTTSASVVAILLPSATIEEPRRSKFVCFMPVMLAKRASAVAASSAARFVDSPMSIIVRVKLRTFLFLIPSWPAASATPAMASRDAGISLAISRMPWRSLANSGSVASMVLRTPANALENFIDSRIAKPPSAATGSVMPLVRVMPTAAAPAPKLVMDREAPSRPAAVPAPASSACFCRRPRSRMAALAPEPL